MSDPREGMLSRLTGGDRRSIGRSAEVVRDVLADPRLIAELAAGLWHADPVVPMRARDALEKISRHRPEWLRPLRSRLLRLAAASEAQETRWHLCQMLPRLGLTPRQRGRLAAILDLYLADRSAIVQASALQALADLAAIDRTLRARALSRIRERLAGGRPAVRARARRLLPLLRRRATRS